MTLGSFGGIALPKPNIGPVWHFGIYIHEGRNTVPHCLQLLEEGLNFVIRHQNPSPLYVVVFENLGKGAYCTDQALEGVICGA